jgi:PAS domain S-box-containing protein
MNAPGVDRFIEGFIEQDTHLRITRWSDESERLFGWTAAEAIEDRDGALFIATFVRAITPDARAEAAFRQRDRYRAILNQLEDGCSVVDLRGNFLFVNDAFCRIFGLRAKAARRSAPPPLRQARVLVAEDNIVNQRVARGVLTTRSHLVTVVSNGREALRDGAFDLVLMDVQMPDMDGFEATAAIRAWGRGSGGTCASSR